MRPMILALLVVITAGFVFFLQQQQETETPLAGGALFGSFKQWNEVENITLEDADGVIFSAKKEYGEWVATHLDSSLVFPVDESALKSVMQSLSEASIVEYKTANPSLYYKLGVQDVNEPNAQSVSLSLVTPDNESALVALFGKPASSGQGQYARLANGKRSVLIDKVLSLPSNAVDWLSRKLFSFDQSQVRRVTVSNQSKTLELDRNEEGGWRFQAKTDAQEFIYPNVIEDVVSDMLRLEYTDIEGYNEQQWQQQDIDAKVNLELENAAPVTIHISQPDEVQMRKVWIEQGVSSWLSEWVFVVSDYQAQKLLIDETAIVTEPTEENDE